MQSTLCINARNAEGNFNFRIDNVPRTSSFEKEGYLTTYDQPFQGRNRRYYQITSDGEQHLEQVYKMWTDYKESLDQVFIPDKEHDLTHKNDIEA